MGFMPYHEAVKTQTSLWDLAVREQITYRRLLCLLCLIEFFILIYEIYIAEARDKGRDHTGTL